MYVCVCHGISEKRLHQAIERDNRVARRQVAQMTVECCGGRVVVEQHAGPTPPHRAPDQRGQTGP